MKYRNKAQGMVEYALLLALVALAAVIILSILGRAIQGGIGVVTGSLGGSHDANEEKGAIEILTAQCFAVQSQHLTGLWITGITTHSVAELTAGTNLGMGTGMDGLPSPVTAGDAPGTFRFNPLISNTRADVGLCPKGAVVQGQGLIAVAPVAAENVP
ncbi:MAG: hypothetical protein IAE83_21070 [Anaerolinea sp.]|nr:hypothetical protein [Anaerolinea sp.]